MQPEEICWRRMLDDLLDETTKYRTDQQIQRKLLVTDTPNYLMIGIIINIIRNYKLQARVYYSEKRMPNISLAQTK